MSERGTPRVNEATKATVSPRRNETNGDETKGPRSPHAPVGRAAADKCADLDRAGYVVRPPLVSVSSCSHPLTPSPRQASSCAPTAFCACLERAFSTATASSRARSPRARGETVPYPRGAVSAAYPARAPPARRCHRAGARRRGAALRSVQPPRAHASSPRLARRQQLERLGHHAAVTAAPVL